MGWTGGIAKAACPSPCWYCVRGIMLSTLPLLLASQKWQCVAFLYLIVHNCPKCASMQLFLVPYCFFVSVA